MDNLKLSRKNWATPFVDGGEDIMIDRMGRKPFIVVGIPAFNEEKTIAKIVIEAQKYADKVIVCDDGSTDYTAEIAQRLGADVYSHDTNLGYGAALQNLFNKAKELGADIFITLDGDGQHSPSDIPALVKPILEGEANIVIGSRFLGDKNNVPRYRRLGIDMITKLAAAASKYDLSDAQCGFRVYDRKAIEELSLYENGMSASVEILLEAKKHDLEIVEVPTKCDYRGLERTSTQNPFSHGVNVIMSLIRLIVEGRPLVYLGIPGIILMIIGAFFAVWMLQIYAVFGFIPTNVALASISFILAGLFATFTSIMLYAMTRVTERNHK